MASGKPSLYRGPNLEMEFHPGRLNGFQLGFFLVWVAKQTLSAIVSDPKFLTSFVVDIKLKREGQCATESLALFTEEQPCLKNETQASTVLGPLRSRDLFRVHECLAKYASYLNQSSPDEPGCPVIFDSWKCWPAAKPGQTLRQNCPDFRHLGFDKTSE